MKTIVEPDKPRALHLTQTQSRPRIPLARLRPVVRRFLNHLRLDRYRLAIHLVGRRRITQLNERFLRHAGPTDVIAFDYGPETPGVDLHGEVFVCVGEVLRQARRYKATGPEELVRTIVHGVLHLRGYRDHSPSKRLRMKAAEGRWLRKLRKEFALDSLVPRGCGERRRAEDR